MRFLELFNKLFRQSDEMDEAMYNELLLLLPKDLRDANLELLEVNEERILIENIVENICDLSIDITSRLYDFICRQVENHEIRNRESFEQLKMRFDSQRNRL